MAKKAAKKEAPKKEKKPAAKKAEKPAALKAAKSPKASKAAKEAAPKEAAAAPAEKVKAPKEPKISAKQKRETAAKLAEATEDAKKWNEFKEKFGKEKAQTYSMSGTFEAQTPIQHKLLGWGFIVSNNNDRLEVLFESGKKILISNYNTNE